MDEFCWPFVKLGNNIMPNSVACHCFFSRLRLLSTDVTVSFLNDLSQCHLIIGFLMLASDWATQLIPEGHLWPTSQAEGKNVWCEKSWSWNSSTITDHRVVLGIIPVWERDKCMVTSCMAHYFLSLGISLVTCKMGIKVSSLWGWMR